MGTGRRIYRGLATVALASALVVASASCGGITESGTRAYCVILPDSVGVYADNPVTQMGYRIGTINKITPSASSVRVDFTISDSRPLPGDVKAVVRSTSILADRALELVGNYRSGPELRTDQCIPRERSVTPKSLSEVIGSANEFINGITPEHSSNLADTIRLLDDATRSNGAGVNNILTVSARLLDNPDQSISDLTSIIGNVATLTDTLVELRDPMKQILNDAVITTPDVAEITGGGASVIAQPIQGLIQAISDLETHAGDEVQLTLDVVADLLRINTPHIEGWISLFGGILKPLPWWINAIANHYNNLNYFPLHYRPPLYRIRTPNGPVVCNVMNAFNPGTCANVAGQPYHVDIDLLQYVFMEASR